jgi:hypothetical protein
MNKTFNDLCDGDNVYVYEIGNSKMHKVKVQQCFMPNSYLHFSDRTIRMDLMIVFEKKLETFHGNVCHMFIDVDEKVERVCDELICSIYKEDIFNYILNNKINDVNLK